MSKRFRVYAIMTASKFLGEYEAETASEASDMAEKEADVWVSLCHQCAGEVDLGDVHDFQVEEV